MKKTLIGIALILGDLIFLNFKVLSSKLKISSNNEISNTSPYPSPTPINIQNLESRIMNLEQKAKITTTPAPTAKITVPPPVLAMPPKTKVRSVQYVTIPGSGSSQNNNWTDLPGTDFYFDTGDYPGLSEVYFEANMKLFNGNGTAYVRLFDTNHGIGVQGSEIGSNKQADTLIDSGKVTFWAGKNLIRVQAKTLTADTTIYNYGRLRIVTVN
jgi:hypothetical protein